MTNRKLLTALMAGCMALTIVGPASAQSSLHALQFYHPYDWQDAIKETFKCQNDIIVDVVPDHTTPRGWALVYHHGDDMRVFTIVSIENHALQGQNVSIDVYGVDPASNTKARLQSYSDVPWWSFDSGAEAFNVLGLATPRYLVRVKGNKSCR